MTQRNLYAVAYDGIVHAKYGVSTMPGETTLCGQSTPEETAAKTVSWYGTTMENFLAADGTMGLNLDRDVYDVCESCQKELGLRNGSDVPMRQP